MVWQLYPEQADMAKEGLETFLKYGLVYFSAQERCGKTLASIEVCEQLDFVKNVLVITKKEPKKDWIEALANYTHKKLYTVTNYHQAKNVKGKYDIVILDEAHNYISGYPERKSTWKQVFKVVYSLPIIYISATAHAQGRWMMFNQLAMSKASPWKQYSNGYDWFKDYALRDANGQLPMVHINAYRKAINYKAVDDIKIEKDIQHLFVARTRKEQGFEHEPEDILHYIDLDKEYKKIYNTVAKDKILDFEHNGKDYKLVCDTPIKLRWSLHMLEGGTLKIGKEYFDLNNDEKAQYIIDTWGDTEDLAIMYQYKADYIKLNRMFNKAKLLQSTRFAEGIDLHKTKTLVVYSQDFSTARHSQRRARQANKKRDEEIKVHFILIKKAVSEQVYTTVSINKENFVDSRFIPMEI